MVVSAIICQSAVSLCFGSLKCFGFHFQLPDLMITVNFVEINYVLSWVRTLVNGCRFSCFVFLEELKNTKSRKTKLCSALILHTERKIERISKCSYEINWGILNRPTSTCWFTYFDGWDFGVHFISELNHCEMYEQ